MTHDPTPPDDARAHEDTAPDAPDANPQLPAELVEALRALDGPAVTPSAEHDAALLAEAREHLAGAPELAGVEIQEVQRRGRPRHVLAFIGAGGAVAAAAAVTFAVIVGQGENNNPTSPAVAQSDALEPRDDQDIWQPADAGRDAGRPPSPVAVAGDLDRSGTVDILDAFALARAIERSGGDPASATNDFNGDGMVDTRDADWLAQQAVAVRQDGGQG